MLDRSLLFRSTVLAVLCAAVAKFALVAAVAGGGLPTWACVVFIVCGVFLGVLGLKLSYHVIAYVVRDIRNAWYRRRCRCQYCGGHDEQGVNAGAFDERVWLCRWCSEDVLRNSYARFARQGVQDA